MRVLLALGISLPMIVACGPREAVITDINESSVRVLQYYNTPDSAVAREAERGCQLYGKEAVGLSTTCLDGFCDSQEHLFACQ